jgi:LDH2 family malate/lactate/ureidoglycolate dehydrogenase
MLDFRLDVTIAVAVRSALWHEVEALAEKGLVGLALLNSKSFVVHHGATRGTEDAMVYGTNPVAFAFPRPDGLPPLLWDQVPPVQPRSRTLLLGCPPQH